MAFHTSDHVLVTGSEDCTLKIWNVQRSPGARKAASALVDVEPVHTLRGHRCALVVTSAGQCDPSSLPPSSSLLLSSSRGAVLCVAMGNGGNVCFSGGVDSTIRAWQLPTDLSDPYGLYGTPSPPL